MRRADERAGDHSVPVPSVVHRWLHNAKSVLKVLQNR